MKKRMLCLCIALLMLFVLCSCSGAYNKKIEKLELIPVDERTEEDWENLVKYYELAGRDFGELRNAYFSGDIQNEYYSERYFPIYEQLKLPAPVVNIAEGTFSDPITLSFEAEDYPYGSLCINVNWYDDGEKSLTVYDQEVVLSEVRNYSVSAYVIQKGTDDFCISDEFYGTYRIENSDLQEITFAQESGNYKTPFAVSVNAVDTGKIYYTTDGTDPVVNGEIKGTLYEGGEISLPMGFTSVKARHILDNGLAGPMSTGEYYVSRPVAQRNNFVAENSRFEYVVENGVVVARNKATGETSKFEYENFNAQSVYADSEKKSARDEMGESRYNEVAIAGEVAVALNRAFWRDNLYVNLSHKYNNKSKSSYVKYVFVNDECQDQKSGEGTYKKTSNIELPKLNTNGGFTQDFYSLHTDDIIVYSQYVSTDEGRKIYVKKCNIDGSDDKLLWEEFEYSIGLGWITFDAIIGDYVFCEYYYNSVRASKSSSKVIREGYEENYVYNLATGKKVENALVKDGWSFYGALSDAVFMSRKTADGKYEYKRIAYDDLSSVFGV